MLVRIQSGVLTIWPFSHRHTPKEDIFWIDGQKQYGQVCECGATRYMTAGGLIGRQLGHKNCKLYSNWKVGTTWSKYQPRG